MSPFGLCDLRGFWPCSSLDENQTLYDISGQGRHMTGDGTPTSYLHNSKIPFIQYGGSNFHYRPDEAGIQITGSLTMGLWVSLDVADNPSLFVKHVGGTRAYGIDVTSGVFRFYVYAAALTAVSSPVAITAGNYYFVAGRFISGQSVSIFVNGVLTSSVTANTTITNAAADLYIGTQGGLTKFLTGKVAWPFIAANAASDVQIRQMYDSAKSAFGVYQ